MRHSENPPPYNMVESQDQISLDPFWHLVPSVTNFPFILSLPLDVGPPPFQSKRARIRYVLCITPLIRGQGKQYRKDVGRYFRLICVRP